MLVNWITATTKKRTLYDDLLQPHSGDCSFAAVFSRVIAKKTLIILMIFFKYLITFLHTILYSLIGFDYVFCSTSATLSPNPKLRIFWRQCKTTLASHCIVYPFIQCPLQFVLLFIPNMILRQNSLTGNYLSNLSIRTQSLPAEFQIKILNNKDRPSLLGLP